MFLDILKRFIFRIIWRFCKPNHSDYKKYVDSIGIHLYPKIASIDETIEELISKKKSIVRFGDGEFMICFGRDINPKCPLGIININIFSFVPELFNPYSSIHLQSHINNYTIFGIFNN